MLYFAYGSNLDWKQMRERCPSSRFVGAARLDGHRLMFTRRSTTRGCGVADVVPSPGQCVWGVVYEIDEGDIGGLDASEGYVPGREKNAYSRYESHVEIDGDPKKPLLAYVYVASREENPPLPSADYKRLIVEGAKFWHLPAGYVAELEKIEAGA